MHFLKKHFAVMPVKKGECLNMSVSNYWKKTMYVIVSSIHQAPTMFQVLRIQKRKRHGWSLLSENSQFLAKIQRAHPCNSIMILFYSFGFELIKYQMNSQYFLYVFKMSKAVICMEQKWTTPEGYMASETTYTFCAFSVVGRGQH